MRGQTPGMHQRALCVISSFLLNIPHEKERFIMNLRCPHPRVCKLTLAVVSLALCCWFLFPAPAAAQVPGCQKCVYKFECYEQTCWFFEDCASGGNWKRCEIWPGGSCYTDALCFLVFHDPELPSGLSRPVTGVDETPMARHSLILLSAPHRAYTVETSDLLCTG